MVFKGKLGKFMGKYAADAKATPQHKYEASGGDEGFLGKISVDSLTLWCPLLQRCSSHVLMGICASISPSGLGSMLLQVLAKFRQL